MDFYNRLNYSLGNEDWSTEEQALRIQPNDQTLCVTASGDRPLHLLMTDCAEVIAIDMNRIQNFLLELKLAAILHLDFETYLAFLGCEPTNQRYSIFLSLTSHLSKDATDFWKNHKKSIQRGIIYQGKVERLTHYTAKIFSLLKGKKIKKLFSFDDIHSQREFIHTHWNTTVLKQLFNICFNPGILKVCINDPGILAYVDSNINPGKYMYGRMIDYLNNHLAKKSVLLQLLCTGKITKEAYFPYMTFAGYEKIRKNAHKLKFDTVNIIEYLNHTPNRFDCFSLSDITSYMSQENFTRLLTGIHYAAKPNARFCLRKLMCGNIIPSHLSSHFIRDLPLETKLEKEESNFVYRFLTGTINK